MGKKRAYSASSAAFAAACLAHDVRIRAIGETIRVTTHLDVDAAACDRAAEVIHAVASYLAARRA